MLEYESIMESHLIHSSRHYFLFGDLHHLSEANQNHLFILKVPNLHASSVDQKSSGIVCQVGIHPKVKRVIRIDHFIGAGWLFQIYIFLHPYMGKWSNLTNILQLGWNQQPGWIFQSKLMDFHHHHHVLRWGYVGPSEVFCCPTLLVTLRDHLT